MARDEIVARRRVPSEQVDKLVADGHAYVSTTGRLGLRTVRLAAVHGMRCLSCRRLSWRPVPWLTFPALAFLCPPFCSPLPCGLPTSVCVGRHSRLAQVRKLMDLAA